MRRQKPVVSAAEKEGNKQASKTGSSAKWFTRKHEEATRMNLELMKSGRVGKMKTGKKLGILACLAVGLICAPVCEAATNLDAIAEGNTAFALDLYGKLKAEDGNLFFSPYSISTALAMTYAGARGDTRTQMATALHFPAADLDVPAIDVNAAFLDLQTHIQKIGEAGNVRLEVANSLWPHKTYPFLPEYLALTKKYYGVSITPLDYTQPEAARVTINNWVEDKTQKKITNLIPSGALDPLTRLVLVNAIYFKGNWASQFLASQTEDAPFYMMPKHQVSVRMMKQKMVFRYAEFDTLQVIEVPYVRNELSMLVLLPKNGTTLAQLEKDFSASNLKKWRTMSYHEVRLFLPKFKMTWQSSSLNSAMQSLGIRDAFVDGKADFSGLDGSKYFYIGGIIHKAFVDVNEDGTEAAAASSIAFGVESRPPPPPVFRADHPFLFVIQENRTGSILFMGRVVNPNAG